MREIYQDTSFGRSYNFQTSFDCGDFEEAQLESKSYSVNNFRHSTDPKASYKSSVKSCSFDSQSQRFRKFGP